jgi:hypothetical protein
MGTDTERMKTLQATSVIPDHYLDEIPEKMDRLNLLSTILQKLNRHLKQPMIKAHIMLSIQ